jgi:hypothetical protein
LQCTQAASSLATGWRSAGVRKTPLEDSNLPHNWDAWADGCLAYPPGRAAWVWAAYAAYAAYASNSSVCALGLWRSSRACQYGGARAGARGTGPPNFATSFSAVARQRGTSILP